MTMSVDIGVMMHGLWLFVMLCCTAVIVYTDISWYWIPDTIVCVVAVCNGVMGLWDNGAATLIGSMAHTGAAWNMCLNIGIAVFFLLLYCINPHGIGIGDVKLVGALCLGCVEFMAYWMVLVAFLTALLGAACMRLWRGHHMIPFGPFLWLGWWCSLLFCGEWMLWL